MITQKLPQKALCSCHGNLPDPSEVGTNAYVLDLSDSLGTSPIFNAEDPTVHRGTFEPPCLPIGVCVGTQVFRLLSLPQSQTDIEAELDDEFVSYARGGF